MNFAFPLEKTPELVMPILSNSSFINVFTNPSQDPLLLSSYNFSPFTPWTTRFCNAFKSKDFTPLSRTPSSRSSSSRSSSSSSSSSVKDQKSTACSENQESEERRRRDPGRLKKLFLLQQNNEILLFGTGTFKAKEEISDKTKLRTKVGSKNSKKGESCQNY